MDRHALARLRWSGLAGIAGSIGYVVGDVLLLGNTATAAEFPFLALHVDSVLLQRLIQRSAMFLASSTERLAAGALFGVFSTPLYLAGVWHIYRASTPGGIRWSLYPFLLLITAFSIAPFVHGSFFYVAEIVKSIGQVDGPAQAAVMALAARAALWLFVAYGVLAVPAVIGFAWLTIAIVRGKTLYPRWVALANPLVCLLAGVVVDRALPQPLAMLLAGAGFSVGLLVFFVLSTVVLWHPPASGSAPVTSTTGG